MSEPIDIEGLRELLAKATEGPWDAQDMYGLVMPSKIDGFVFPERRAEHQAQIDADAELIVAARNALPGLLDELDRLRNVVRVLDAANDQQRAKLAAVEALANWWDSGPSRTRDTMSREVAALEIRKALGAESSERVEP